MGTKFNAASYNFRKKLPFISKDYLHWFPGHMSKGLKQIQRKLKSMDCIIEVMDARIPFTGRNPLFSNTVLGAKPHILVLNKRDLTIQSLKKKVEQQLKDEQNVENVVYTNSKDQNCRGLRSLKPLMIDLITKSERYNRNTAEDFNVMIIGVPNVGKSSLINMMRTQNMKVGHSLPVGAKAGITRSVLMKMRINNNPNIFMLDTPGILEPTVTNIEMGLKLALCASLQDHLVGEEAIADYLLYWLNSHQHFKYVRFMGLTEPSDDINEVLLGGAQKFNKIRKVRDFDGKIREVPDLLETAKEMIRSFRTGELGKMLLDIDMLKDVEPDIDRGTGPEEVL